MTDIVHIDFGVSKDCVNPDSYGEICVKCNSCGRFNKDTMWESRYNLLWYRLAEELNKHGSEYFRSDLQQTNIAKNIIYFGEKILECVKHMDFDEGNPKVEATTTLDYMCLVQDIKSIGMGDICNICKHHNEEPDCECDCETCKKPCACKDCLNCSMWKWRGE